MAGFEQDAKKLLTAIGGAENIASVAHCATRMRFVLHNPENANIDDIENISAVKGTFTQAGQFQVIIGNDVQLFYNDFTRISGVEGVTKDSLKADAKQNMNVVQKMLAVLAEIFSPIIPAIVVGGLILGFRNVLGEMFLLEEGTKRIIDIYPFWSGVNHFLWLIGEAIFHFLPVGITWSVAKKMGTTQILGIVLGITLVSPQLLNAYGVVTATEIPFWDFGFAQVSMIGYQAQVLPAILAGLLLAYLEIGLRKIIPNAVSMIFVPLFSLIPTVLLAHTILGPIGWAIGNAISNVVYAGLTSTLNWLFAAIFGFLYAPLVITGLHHMSNAVDLQLMSIFDGTNLWPMIALSNIAQGSAVLAVIFLHKGNEKEEQVSVPATISCYLGVTEPAMFGINLKYLYPFIAAMIGSSLAAVISVSGGVMANSIGVGGLPGILSIKPQFMMTFAICMVVAIVVPFVLTIVFRKYNILNKQDQAPVWFFKQEAGSGIQDEPETVLAEEILSAPMAGRAVAVTEVKDETFAKEMLGPGMAIIPQEGKLLAPADGTIVTVFPTGHALGMVTEGGIEILIHVGMDTVSLEGKYFTPRVKAGDQVKRGQLLLEFDLEAIKKEGFDMTTPIVVTNKKEEWHLALLNEGELQAGSQIMKITNM